MMANQPWLHAAASAIGSSIRILVHLSGTEEAVFPKLGTFPLSPSNQLVSHMPANPKPIPCVNVTLEVH